MLSLEASKRVPYSLQALFGDGFSLAQQRRARVENEQSHVKKKAWME